MEITLPPDLQAIVEEQVRRGLYRDASAAISAALRWVWNGPSADSRELVAMLLEGVEGPHEPLTEKTREEIRQIAANLPDEWASGGTFSNERRSTLRSSTSGTSRKQALT